MSVRTSHTSQIARPLQCLTSRPAAQGRVSRTGLREPKKQGQGNTQESTALPHRSDLLATAGCDCRAIFSTDNDLNAPIQLPAAGLRIVRDRVRLAVPLRCDARCADSTI